MPRRLPPLNALRAFEAAARHLSFLKAAEELAVTAGAVSQQIRSLEEQVGVRLFRRLSRGVLLTDAGQRYGSRIGELLDGIAAATLELRRFDRSAPLTVSTSPSFAARWLIPRLASFRVAHPEIAVRVLADNKLSDFATDEVDLVIRFGMGRYPGMTSDLLFHAEAFPVCSPKLLAQGPKLEHLADLANHTLLHDEPEDNSDEFDWRRWLAAVGAPEIEVKPGPGFTYTHMVLQAAVAGQGVALGTTVLAGDDLTAGNLVRPLVESVKEANSYWVVCPEATANQPRTRAFRDWIRVEAMRFKDAASIRPVRSVLPSS